ncbi:ribosome recycling factor [Candidatus Woesebacteria bacterium RIFOXYB1_FULL_47_31]|uniref:Ribosome recycling factor n=9 Tax=Candidatus Woeseibacteriota TaxID=1752722 RepID=A0A1F8D117_9BACT|nr:MAG: ribosome recycling factor [Candidatus Woesebacteria bacterium RIFOXYA1_FULL_48_16]OGM82046.1 MAG: ribosome recycling factor [Candidatus Woesebacteria bacterium RIFOXYB1_FULL_47_31]OGM84795.1 MAG: ribosome recycling factor [Candidatus Woesebacteria bacterium RIFOXYC1_FULL_46_16]OGM89204.1 MAG: ribosome recycling factor [Candidatus Woesebacteria bacterium RIFOXYD1_FULL_46_19]
MMDEPSVRSKMSEVVDLITSDIGAIRTGRAAPALVEGLEIAVYGGAQKLKIQELATISAPDTQTLVIDPWDKSIIGEIKQGILAANVGINPMIDGEIIRIALPPLTTEDREKYVKLLSAKLENGRVMTRQIRGNVMHEIRKKFEAKEITEDEKFAQEKRLQEITDEFIGKIEAVGERKKAELIQI